jgi:hypothetical protein
MGLAPLSRPHSTTWQKCGLSPKKRQAMPRSAPTKASDDHVQPERQNYDVKNDDVEHK